MTGNPLSAPNAPMRYRLAIAAYQMVLAAAMPLVWRYFRRRSSRDPKYGLHLDERRGGTGARVADVWIHAVSLGEFRSAQPVIDALLDSGVSIVLTHATPAGRTASETALGAAIASGQVQVRYAPVDLISAWAQFFATASPRVGLVFEMEFWPGMTEAAMRAGVDMWFVNAQMPEKSYPRARKVFSALGAHPVSRATGVCAKSTRMADRFNALGAKSVVVAGETRFDIDPPEVQIAAGAELKSSLRGRPVFTFASVVEGEEATYLAACKSLAKTMERPLVIWVPRAPEAFVNTFNMLADSGLRAARRTLTFSDTLVAESSLDAVDVLVGDSFGEMFFYLSIADVVSVGGGFVEKGAHNVIEPLALGKPVVTGPHVWTIEFPGREARDAEVLTVCDDPENLAVVLEAAFGAPPDAAEAFHRANIGASARIVTLVQDVLEQQR